MEGIIAGGKQILAKFKHAMIIVNMPVALRHRLIFSISGTLD
jgi:hypothetical protein